MNVDYEKSMIHFQILKEKSNLIFIYQVIKLFILMIFIISGNSIYYMLSILSQQKYLIFQPHIYGTRFANDFANSLSEADKLILLDIYPARENQLKINSQMLLDLCSNDCKMILDKKELLNHIKRNENDLVMTLGAGDISDLVAPIKEY